MMNLKELKLFSHNFKLLYVEDDDAIRDSMQSYLAKFFSLVVSAENGLEGLKKYKEGHFDIVVTDLSMPKMNGIEMIQKIKEIDSNQAILITTAHSESDYLVNAIKIGVDGYVIKPFDFTQLNSELAKIAEKLYKYAQNETYKEHLEEMVLVKSKELQKVLEYENENYEQTLFSMVEMIEARDTYTAGHSRRVAEYSKLIAQEMGYSEADCTKIYQAGFLHDVGKIATPDTVLLNPKKLNDIEYKLIQEHVTVGYQLLSHVPMFKDLAEIVRSHHERYDGGGYPDGLKADEINPLSQIMIVADAFDAMTTNRIYKARKSTDEALQELKDFSGIQFHPKVVASAIKALKSIDIDENINQLPITVLEQERFAYFYKDTISSAYNQNYLDVVLLKNREDKKYKYLDIFYLKHFSQFNREHTWEEGNKLLKEFVLLLEKNFTHSLVFRIFGDDFAVLSTEENSFESLFKELEALFLDICVACEHKLYNLEKTLIKSIDEINNSQE